ncbi:helix-turn-helix transcriptional regulator [Hyalangium gracile]|uniref:helix-turn-helix transcriptional regulator n=1 Tax=Hyalangium gracile TaxID=394092 RepID=UPI001CCAA919
MATRKSPHSHGRSEVRTRKDLAPAIRRALKRLGSRLRDLRVERRLSQEEAAEAMGIHPKSMPRLEGGTTNPTVATLVAASVAYKVSLRDLFPDREEEEGAK